MSHQNVEIVRKGFEHFLARGEPAWSTLDDEIEVHDHDILDAGEYRGHEGFGRWLEDWASAWSEFTMEPEEFVDAGECVVVVLRMKATGRGSGARVDRQDAMVWRMGPDRKFVRVDYFNNREQALAAAGLPA
jgi:ketosteroid isomerase-like protein